MQVTASDPPAGQRMADDCVATVVDGQRLKTRGAESLARRPKAP
jgi:hypothetical protein